MDKIEKIPEVERLDTEQLVKDMQKTGLDAHYIDSTDKIVEYISAQCKKGDVVLIMSNGGFDNIHDKLLKQLKG